MEQSLGEPEGEPQPDIYAEIEIRDHRLPDGYFPTKSQLFAAIMGIQITPSESSE